MRQFVLGIIAAALVLWGYQNWQGDGAQAGAGDPTGPGSQNLGPEGGGPLDGGAGLSQQPVNARAADDGSLGALLGAGQAPAAHSNPKATESQQAGTPQAGLGTGATGASRTQVDAVVAALEDAVGGGARGTAAIDAAFVILAHPLAIADRERVARLIGPRGGETFAALLAALGTRNAFLYSPEGRDLATRAVLALDGLSDAEKCAGGSLLLNVCLRGRIDKQDQEARRFVDEIYRRHRAVVDRWLCDPANVARARSHTIEPGRGLGAVAAKFRREEILVDASSLAVLNRIHNENHVRAGQKIKVPLDPIHAVLEKRSYSLAVYVGADLLRLYWVGHGENDKTPVTEFTVVEKQHRPQWTAPNGRAYPYGHPENILGEYFIKFEHASYTGFGAHGTPQPETICTMSSAGCIRMLAADIDDLFQVLPRGAKVEVRASEAARL